MKQQLKEREKELKSIFENFHTDGITVIPPKAIKIIQKVEKELNVKLEPVLKSFYETCDRFSFSWKGIINNFCITGNTNIRSVLLLNSLNTGNYELSFTEVDNQEKIDTSKLLIFNRIDTLGNYVLIQIEQNTTLLFLYTYDKKINKLNLTIEEYLNKLVFYFGVELWQQFYIENPSKISNFYLYDNRYTLFLERLLNHEIEDYQVIINPLENLKEKYSFSNSSIVYKDQIQKNISKRLNLEDKIRKTKS